VILYIDLRGSIYTKFTHLTRPTLPVGAVDGNDLGPNGIVWVVGMGWSKHIHTAINPRPTGLNS